MCSDFLWPTNIKIHNKESSTDVSILSLGENKTEFTYFHTGINKIPQTLAQLGFSEEVGVYE